jgi:hypothetical protein
VLVEVSGKLFAPYGQLEVRPATGGVVRLDLAPLPSPTVIGGMDLGETTEGRLVRINGTVTTAPKASTTGDISLTVTSADGAQVKVMADVTSGLDRTALLSGRNYALTGIVGQRASRKDALDGYRIWLRDASDVVLQAGGAGGSGAAGSAPAVQSIAAARLLEGQTVTIEGTVTAGPDLLDATRRRVVVEDATGAVELLLPAPLADLGPGRRIRVTGVMGRAYGAARLRVSSLELLGTAVRTPLALSSGPGPAHEWRLVRISGRIVDVRRLGARWTAELEIGGSRVPIAGLAGSGIPSTALIEGRRATITGIVRRPHPSASDRRFAIAPRSAADLAVAPPDGGGATRAIDGAAAAASPGDAVVGAVDADLGNLEVHLGQLVRVGGLVVELLPDGFVLDDGTAQGRVLLRGPAGELAPLIETGDALNALGRPERLDGDIVLAVERDDAIQLVGDLGEPIDPRLAAALPEAATPEPDATASVTAAGVMNGLEPAPGILGLGSLGLVLLASAAVTGLRRHRARQLVQARVMARLATFVGQRPPPGGGEATGTALGGPRMDA